MNTPHQATKLTYEQTYAQFLRIAPQRIQCTIYSTTGELLATAIAEDVQMALLTAIARLRQQ